MKNLELWDKLKTVPKEAQKTIQSGDLKGMTDIKPQWRYKAMTEEFGPCGIGWYYEITEKRIEEGNNQEKCGFVDVNLFIKVDGEWSKPIPGTGGNSFVQFFNTKKYYKTSDEVFKMAMTDALSVAMAKIGVGASIYMGENDGAKYTSPSTNNQSAKKDYPKIETWLTEDQFNKTMKADKKGIEATLKAFDGTNAKGMKKEYREQLTNKLKTL